MNNTPDDRLIEYLAGFITENKKNKITKVLKNRTRHITVVLEDIYQPHNASAVIRSCECFGIQNIHVIESKNRYSPNPDVTMGSNKWIDISYHGTGQSKHALQNTHDCITKLKEDDYKIIAMTPHDSSFTLETLPLNTKTALLFGSEENGLSKQAILESDACLGLPMFGFTESYNISVSVALALYAIINRLQNENIDYLLNDFEKKALRLKWYRKILKKHKHYEERFFIDRQNENT